MITTPSFYRGFEEISHIGNNEPNSSIIGNGVQLNHFIDRYEGGLLDKCLTYSISKVFKENLESVAGQAKTVKETADQKWKDLMDGKEYEIDGKAVKWRGLVFKENGIDQSLIVPYIYSKFVEYDMSTYAGIGLQVEKSKNSKRADHSPKWLHAKNAFIEMVIGDFNEVFYGTSVHIYDHRNRWVYGNRNDSGIRSLYQFISDMNAVDSTTYEGWRPYYFANANRMGI